MAAKAPLVLLALVATASADDKRHTLADLETLVAGHAYQEALDHAGDVAPADRSQKWVDVTAAAAAGVVGMVSTDDGMALVAIDAIDRQYPQLLKVAGYSRVRGERGLASLAPCWARTFECSKLAARFAANDARLTIDVAKIAARYDKPLAVSLYRGALRPELCKSAELAQAMVGGLGQAPDAPAAGDARALMTTCWSDVKGAVLDAFDGAGKGGNLYRNTCPTLLAKNVLSSLQAKRCK